MEHPAELAKPTGPVIVPGRTPPAPRAKCALSLPGGSVGLVWIGVGIVLASAVVVAICAARAPTGYQDETGFHFGQEPRRPPERRSDKDIAA